MSQITNRDTIEIEVAVLYGEDVVLMEFPDGEVRRESVDSNRNVLTVLDVPEPDHTIGLAGLGRANALDAHRSGSA